MHFGARLIDKGVEFNLWAPKHSSARLIHWLDGEERRCEMRRETDGQFSIVLDDASCGDCYLYELPDGTLVADPASRYQPMGENGPSEVVHPSAFQWTDGDWIGLPWKETVFYEIHVGCFSDSGDFLGVSRHLDYLQSLGITALELMPIQEFTGDRNWGYDGLFPYSPSSVYGRPEHLAALVDDCHAHGLMVFLDVVYNHFGATERSLKLCSPDFFHSEINTPWGSALAFDNELLRAYLIDSACSWIRDYHVDGLRLDAVHAIQSVPGGGDFLSELSRVVRCVDSNRHIHLVLENDFNEASWLPSLSSASTSETEHKRCNYDAQWNDDFHHAAHALATGESDGYYVDYSEEPFGYLIKTLTEGFAYQGEPSVYREGRQRGECSADRDPSAFVNFLQNHDQVGNRAFGERLASLATWGVIRVLHAVLLLSPQVPLLFMGEEWDAESPFFYFCDVPEPLASAVRSGRQSEFAHFDRYRELALPDPCEMGTYLKSHLNWNDLESRFHQEAVEFTKYLLNQRRKCLTPRLPIVTRATLEARKGRAAHLVWELSDGGFWHLLFGFTGSLEDFQRPSGTCVVSLNHGAGQNSSWLSVFSCVGSPNN